MSITPEDMMTEQQRQLAIHLLRAQAVTRVNKNAALRKAFGTRITVALKAEVDHRDREIEVLNILIEELEARGA